MPKFKKASEQVEEVSAEPVDVSKVQGLDLLAQAIAQATRDAIAASKPVEKKTILNYKGVTPWTPKNGEPRAKPRRKFYVHNLLVDPEMHTNEEIELFNKVRPGVYCDGFIKVERRRDKGINVTWPIKTADQKMRLSSVYGINSLVALLTRCMEEAENPTKRPEDE